MFEEALDDQRFFFWCGESGVRAISESVRIDFDHFEWQLFDRRAAEENPCKNEACHFWALFLAGRRAFVILYFLSILQRKSALR